MFTKLLLVILFLISLCGGASALPSQTEIDDLLQSAKNAVVKHDFDKADEYFSQIAKLNIPVPNEMYFYYAKTKINSNEPKKALATLERYLTNASVNDANYNEGLDLYLVAERGIQISPEKQYVINGIAQQMVSLPNLGFSIGKYEVTQRQWQSIMGSNPAHFDDCGLDCPIEKVSWHDVKLFIRKLNRISGKEYRLPTEEEWTIACLAGEKTKFCGSNTAHEVAWYSDNSGNKPHPVGLKQANAWGLHDMSGNVYERVEDCYKNDCETRVLRGGSWLSPTQYVLSTNRFGKKPINRYFNGGFRLAQTL